jgi:subtilisin family serine protease
VFWNGTSGAAPIVAGIAALVMQAHPELDVANVINRIITTADRVGKEGNIKYGYGVVDARDAVLAEVPTVTSNPLGTMAQWIEMNRAEDWTSANVEIAVPVNPSSAPEVDEGAQVEADITEFVQTFTLPTLIVGGLLVSFSIAIYGNLLGRKLHRPGDPTV